MRNKLITSLLGILVLSASAKMPGFDIVVGELKLSGDMLQVSQLKGLTSRSDYDNQPMFLADGQSLLYTAAQTKGAVEQTDSVLASLTSATKINLTNSDESEYSPTLMPSGNSFSVIRAVGDKQKLWRYPLFPEQQNAEPASELLARVNPVGYHAWVDDTRVLLFVLGEPHTLQLADIVSQTSTVIDENIGPSLFAIPHSPLMSYTTAIGVGDELEWQLNSYDPQSGRIAKLTMLPTGAYYYGWTGNGYAIVAVDSTLMQWDPSDADKGWQSFADVSAICPKGVTRLSSNAKSTKIALVCTL